MKIKQITFGFVLFFLTSTGHAQSALALGNISQLKSGYIYATSDLGISFCGYQVQADPLSGKLTLQMKDNPITGLYCFGDAPSGIIKPQEFRCSGSTCVSILPRSASIKWYDLLVIDAQGGFSWGIADCDEMTGTFDPLTCPQPKTPNTQFEKTQYTISPKATLFVGSTTFNTSSGPSQDEAYKSALDEAREECAETNDICLEETEYQEVTFVSPPYDSRITVFVRAW
jgi:hypothetical protein